MLITTLAMFLIARYQWNWNRFKTILIFTPLFLIDVSFFSANSLKIFEGGFVPLGIGLGLWGMMKLWEWGREQIKATYRRQMPMNVAKLVKIKQKSTNFIPRSIVFMTSQPIISDKDVIPPLKQVFWERYGVLPKHLIFLTVNVAKAPYVHGDRHEIYKFFEDKNKGSMVAVTANFGFMEKLDVEETLHDLARHKEINIDQNPQKWLIHIQQEKLLLQKGITSKLKRFRFKMFRFMYKNSDGADHFFGLGNKLALTVEITPVIMGS
jgi:KUP system potassium uptake protein